MPNFCLFNDISLKKINLNGNKVLPIITNNGNLSIASQHFENEFKIDCDENKLKVYMVNKDNIKKDLKMLVRKDSTNELIYLSRNDSNTGFELEWKYFLDPRSTYSLFLTIFNDEGKIKKNARFKEKYLIDFSEKELIINNNLKLRIFKTKNGNIMFQSF